MTAATALPGMPPDPREGVHPGSHWPTPPPVPHEDADLFRFAVERLGTQWVVTRYGGRASRDTFSTMAAAELEAIRSCEDARENLDRLTATAYYLHERLGGRMPTPDEFDHAEHNTGNRPTYSTQAPPRGSAPALEADALAECLTCGAVTIVADDATATCCGGFTLPIQS